MFHSFSYPKVIFGVLSWYIQINTLFQSPRIENEPVQKYQFSQFLRHPRQIWRLDPYFLGFGIGNKAVDLLLLLRIHSKYPKYHPKKKTGRWVTYSMRWFWAVSMLTLLSYASMVFFPSTHTRCLDNRYAYFGFYRTAIQFVVVAYGHKYDREFFMASHCMSAQILVL